MIEHFDDSSREDEHSSVARLLGAFVDDELPSALRMRVEAHLAGCEECRLDLEAQTAVRARLMNEALPATVPSFRDRILAHLDLVVAAQARASVGDRPSATTRARRFRWVPLLAASSGWMVAAGLAAFVLLRARSPGAGGMTMSMSMGPAVSVAVDSVPAPEADAALEDFRRVADSALPQGVSLSDLQARIPFVVSALRAPHMRLIAAWTTRFEGEPVAVLAYICHNRLVVQYVVPQRVFFRQPRVRQAIASAGLYAAGTGRVNAVGWPDRDSGSFLVGEFPASELAAMRL